MFRSRQTLSPAVLAIVLVAAVFSIDLALPLGVASAVPYTFAVLLALAARPDWLGPAVALLCCALTIAKMFINEERGTTELWKVIANRCLALFAISMTALLGVLRRRAEERLKAHQAALAHMGRLTMLGQVAAGLAHELNQPLTAISLHADIAMGAAKISPQNEEIAIALHEIASQSARAGEIVRGIRRMARNTEYRQELVPINDIARTAANSLDWLARRAVVVVLLKLSDSEPRIYGDRTQLEQVFFNLLQNGIEAVGGGPAGGIRQVLLQTICENEMVQVIVRDTGPGISDSTRLFEQFHTTKPDGLGLGLAISRAIIEAHGGQLTGNSGEGRGAEFTFTLPLAASMEKP